MGEIQPQIQRNLLQIYCRSLVVGYAKFVENFLQKPMEDYRAMQKADKSHLNLDWEIAAASCCSQSHVIISQLSS